MKGRYSIKAVLPALTSDSSYSKMTINKGMEASNNYKQYFKSLKEAESGKIAKPILNNIDYLSNMMRDVFGEFSTVSNAENVYSSHNIARLQILKEQLDSI